MGAAVANARKRRFDVRDAMKGVLRALARHWVIRKRRPPDMGGGVVFCSPDAMLSMWKPEWQSDQAVDFFEWARRFVKPGHVV